jgi:hypothetical protein
VFSNSFQFFRALQIKYLDMNAATPHNSDTRQIGEKGTGKIDPHRPYRKMVLKSREIKEKYNILYVILKWLLLLASCVIFPGTFRVMNRVGILNNYQQGRLVRHAIPRSLRGITIASCIIAGCGLIWLWWALKHNYIWLISRLFLYVHKSTNH